MSKATKKRACPAVGRDISPAECGENRGSRYTCPADCPYSPFTLANYDTFQGIEAALIHKSIDWVRADSADRAEFDRAEVTARRIATPNALAAFHLWRFAGRRDAAGLTAVDRWARAGFPGLSNDERVVARARAQLQPVVLEVLRVLDDLRIEVVDLLDPERQRHIIVDRGFASGALRFAVLLTWIYPLPHYWRVAGTAELLPEMGQFAGDEIVREIVQHLGGPTEVPALRLWLLEHFARLDEALLAVSLARREKMLRDMDATFGKAVYQLKAPLAECLARLDRFERGDREAPGEEDRAEGFTDTRVWFAEASTTGVQPEGARPVMGRVLIQPTHWRVEVMGAERYAKLRAAFEALMGGLVQFTGERLDDLAAQMRQRVEPYDASLVPPRLLAGTQLMRVESSRVAIPMERGGPDEALSRVRQEQARTFLDDSIPLLEGKTPREAARDPALRPKLVRLMKQRIRDQDEDNLRTGRADSLDWMLTELGLEEIRFEPPPRRAPKSSPGAAPEDEFIDRLVEARPPAPPLRAQPLGVAETSSRVKATLDAFATAKEALADLDLPGRIVMESVDELAGDQLNDAEQSLLAASVLRAWYALVPPGCAGPAIEFEDIQDEFTRVLKALDSDPNPTQRAPFDSLAKLCDQPTLFALVTLDALDEAKHAPAAERPRQQSVLLIVILLVAVINVTHQALQE